MALLVFCASGLAFSLILLLFDRPRSQYYAKQRRVKRIQEGAKLFTDELEEDFSKRFIKPLISALKQRVERAASRALRKSQANTKLERKLRLAGFYISVEAYTALRLAITVGITLLCTLFALYMELETKEMLLIIASGLLISLLLPTYFLILKSRVRQTSIRMQLPDMMDILSVSIDAGLSFDLALKRGLDRFTGALKEELTISSMEIQMGKPRREALYDLGENNSVAELKTLVAAIIQSEQMGTPIKSVLKTQASHMRLLRKQAAQEKGMKASVKMLLPMVLCIFPVLFIILMGPTVFNIIKVFGEQ